MPTPTVVIHGGAGSITRATLPPSSPSYTSYTASLRRILTATHASLQQGTSALDAATAAVASLEDDPLFNAGKGAVFTSAGTNELEASVMVTRGPGSAKRGVGVALLRTVKNPILLARELLLRPAEQGARHNFITGAEAERLADRWGVETVDERYFWTERRWLEHLRGLERPGEMGCLPQGTVGCVVRDVDGVLCVATSTGGLTNKAPGRIGDTPTLGAGFWAEEWAVPPPAPSAGPGSWLGGVFGGCFPHREEEEEEAAVGEKDPLLRHGSTRATRAVALSGTGNGDYFLRLAAAHAVAARCRFAGMDLAGAVAAVAGVGGELQRAAGERWGAGRGDGEGGFIAVDEAGKVVMDMNCGGMFRGYVDEEGRARVAVFRDEEET